MMEELLARLKELANQVIQAESPALRQRWEIGRLLLPERGGKKKLPVTKLNIIAAETNLDHHEIQYCLRFADKYPDEERFSDAVRQFPTWHRMVHLGLYEPRTKTRDPRPLTILLVPPGRGKDGVSDLFASGFGLRAIAKRLTVEKAIQPLSPSRPDGLTPPGWAPSTVRSILCRDLYRGVIVWNRSRKRDDWGQVNQKPRPAEEWTRQTDENLRIVPDDLWNRVASRRQDTEGKTLRFDSGRLIGRPPKMATQNLLAGLAACGVCGGGLVVETSGRTNCRIAEYICSRHRHNNTCPNALRMPVAEMNEAVLQAVEEIVFTPEAIEQVVALTERDEQRERHDLLRVEATDVDRRIARLTAVLGSDDGAGLASLVAKLRELERRKTDIARQLETCSPVPRLPQQVVQNRLDEWRRLLRASTTQGRSVLQRVLQGRIVFTPHDASDDVIVGTPGYDFHAPTRFDKLFSGVAFKRPAGLPYDSHDDIGPEDTFDADYGALLAKAYSVVENYGKCVASPTGFDARYPTEFEGIWVSERTAA